MTTTTTAGREREARVRGSEYQLWAKTRSQARFNLATSGLAPYPLARLPVRLEELEITGPSLYGYTPLQEALAEKCGVAAECVVAATGTSMANHLVMAALLDAGDEVVVESPAYDPLVAVGHYLGAAVKRFCRRAEDDFRLDPSEVEREVTGRTRLIVLTNLHNPSGSYADEAALARVGELARGVGARVLVDEVYLDAMFEEAPQTSFRLGPEFVVTSSLTKVYGLGGLRCGWVLAEPVLAQRLWRLNDLFGVVPAHVAELLSVVALKHLDRLAAHSRAHLSANRAILDAFLRTRTDLEYTLPRWGTTSFPRLRSGDADALCRLLAEKYETSVVPGRFFESPAHVRIGIGGDTETLRAGLERLGAALDELGRV